MINNISLCHGFKSYHKSTIRHKNYSLKNKLLIWQITF
nr:MAG TPA: hypothetical protein [Caudoviricetes sp.]